MFKIQKIYPRDIIGILAIIGCFICMMKGIDKVVSGIAIMIITYYFSKRLYEERNGYEEKPVEPTPTEPEPEPEKPQPIEQPKPIMPIKPSEIMKKYSQEIRPPVQGQ